MTEQAVLEVETVRKAFGATRALAGASMRVGAGEVHVLLGENGSGKSTLAKIIAGIHRKDEGHIRIGGRDVEIEDARAARRLGVAIVFQELSLAPDLTVADNLFLGREASRLPFAVIDRSRERDACREVLDRLDIDIDLERRVRTLSMAQKQMLEVAKALLQQPVVMILDEPSAMLTEREKAHLFEVVRRLKAAGVAILYITHHLREVAEIGDRVSVMRDGEIVTTLDVSRELTELRLLELLTGRKLSAEVDRARPGEGPPVLRIEDLHVGECRGASLYVRPGEIVGLYGIVGCGREDVARALVGIRAPERGSIVVGGERFRPRGPADALGRGVGYLPMDRKENGILPTRSIRENLNLSTLASFARFGVVAPGGERPTTLERLRRLGVKFATAEHPITSLSGGNQQKVLFGRATARAPRLLVLEDPTAGIDMGAKLDLYRQIKAWAEDGMSFLWLSSDLVETLMLCHRVYTMYDGRIVGEFHDPSLDDEEELLAGVLGRDGAAAATTA